MVTYIAARSGKGVSRGDPERERVRCLRARLVTSLPGGSGHRPGRHYARPARCSLHWRRGGSSRLHPVILGSAARGSAPFAFFAHDLGPKTGHHFSGSCVEGAFSFVAWHDSGAKASRERRSSFPAIAGTDEIDHGSEFSPHHGGTGLVSPGSIPPRWRLISAYCGSSGAKTS